MIHKPLQIIDLELSFSHKTCFEYFNAEIAYGSRIAIIGRNGSGKSTLLKMIAGTFEPFAGTIVRGNEVRVGYVPQVIEDHSALSGGQRFNAALTQALSVRPNLLLLDEPTNHLDNRHRKSLLRMLKFYPHTLIVVSHDTQLLRHCIETLWHIENGEIYIFSGNYDDYLREIKLKRASIENELVTLSQQKKNLHDKRMREQHRVAKSRTKGLKNIENRKWTKMAGGLKGMQAETSQGKKLKAFDETKHRLINRLTELRLPEKIVPRFSINSHEVCTRALVQISGGSVGYSPDHLLLEDICFTLFGRDRIAIIGDNGSGKSTLVKAILGDKILYKTGDWFVVNQEEIGYLDQHYRTLCSNQTVLETIVERAPYWPHTKMRSHLQDFLFRKNEEVNAYISTLSGGEKARLMLAYIAAKPPKLLILDEITNNLDVETKAHVVQVLQSYPGAMLLISHDADFLKEVGVTEFVDVAAFNGRTDG